MSRYPSSQFILIDNTNTTATVPTSGVNATAPTFMTTFKSPKGPEEIRNGVSGTQFFDLYGSQSKILFNKYGQPLLQASMDINAGAILIAKRAVLDDAKLANATICMAITKHYPIKEDGITFDENGYITAVEFDEVGDKTSSNVVVSPVVITLADLYKKDESITENFTESKQLYYDHKNYIENSIKSGKNKIKGIKSSIGTFTFSNKDEKISYSISGTVKNDATIVDVDAINSISFDATTKPTVEVPSEHGEKTAEEFNNEIIEKIYEAVVEDTYIVPLFSIFDNGRGKSLKSISIIQDVASSKTLNKAIYTLKVIDYETDRTIETFAFTIDPYTRNNNTGYTFDIESAVNGVSGQIYTTMYYDNYDALVELLIKASNNTVDSDIFISMDCLFGHDLKGSNCDKISNISIVNNCDANNLDIVATSENNYKNLTTSDLNSTIGYYFINYPYRKKYSNISDRLMFGDNGGFNVGDARTDGSIITEDDLYQDQYYNFFYGIFDRDVFNVDILFPTAVFDANYRSDVKLAIQRLAAFRGDFLAYMDMGLSITSYSSLIERIPEVSSRVGAELDFSDKTYLDKPYIRDMHCAVTCIYGDIRDPYTNKRITVTATYGLSIAMVNHYISGPGKLFCGQKNGIIFNGYIDGTINYVPKVYPTSGMTSLNNINMTYISDDSSITNEKQMTCDVRVNYGSYYDGRFTMDTEFTLNPTESEYSYIHNVMLVNRLVQEIRKTCPSARYSFIDGDDLDSYHKAVETVINQYRSDFASITFKYVQDENSVANKIYYAAIEVVFRPFAQAEIFKITALNYSTLDENITTA